MSSTRLPGKVMKPILGEPMLWRQIERITRATMIDKLVVATSLEPSDDVIADFCRSRNVACFRGALTDVLDRYYQAANVFGPADHIVRLTADCPLTDWNVIDSCVDLHLKEKSDYTSNTIVRTFPDGLDVEVMTFEVLNKAWQEATTPHDREHVTPYIYRSTGRFRLVNLTQERDSSRLRWTVDTPDDFFYVCSVYEALYTRKRCFTTADIVALPITFSRTG